ncbi:unnamed protein product [Thelazia callipaeda]|uniref:Uncharacterized protein n=1 Tax=Thelazia callipaeda TaxID=103827 RepID=A0A0N5D5Q7_THECL|nr:unnamed protein product [Thelazia callipaeda]
MHLQDSYTSTGLWTGRIAAEKGSGNPPMCQPSSATTRFMHGLVKLGSISDTHRDLRWKFHGYGLKAFPHTRSHSV